MSSAFLWGGLVIFVLSVVGLVRGRIWFVSTRGWAAAWLSIALVLAAVGALSGPLPLRAADAATAEARANAKAARESQAAKDAAAQKLLETDLGNDKSVESISIKDGRLTVKTNLSPMDGEHIVSLYQLTRGRGFFSTTILGLGGSVLLEK